MKLLLHNLIIFFEWMMDDKKDVYRNFNEMRE